MVTDQSLDCETVVQEVLNMKLVCILTAQREMVCEVLVNELGRGVIDLSG